MTDRAARRLTSSGSTTKSLVVRAFVRRQASIPRTVSACRIYAMIGGNVAESFETIP